LRCACRVTRRRTPAAGIADLAQRSQKLTASERTVSGCVSGECARHSCAGSSALSGLLVQFDAEAVQELVEAIEEVDRHQLEHALVVRSSFCTAEVWTCSQYSLFWRGRDDEVKKSLLAEINRNLVAAGVVGG
jgi:hypothetical protein